MLVGRFKWAADKPLPNALRADFLGQWKVDPLRHWLSQHHSFPVEMVEVEVKKQDDGRLQQPQIDQAWKERERKCWWR